MIEPTYHEGYARGVSEERRRMEHERLADVFVRDCSQVETLKTMAALIARSLGSVAAIGDGTERALAHELEGKLGKLGLKFEDLVIEHRKAAREG
jgi:hypothetical protein